MKMYVLIRSSVPTGFAILAAAHGALAAYFRFKNSPEVNEWLAGPFSKVICVVNDKEFENAKGVDDHVLITESALGDEEVALAFKPREEWPRAFKFLRLYK